MHNESKLPSANTVETSREYVIDSFETLVCYLGAVALHVPDAVIQILTDPRKK